MVMVLTSNYVRTVHRVIYMYSIVIYGQQCSTHSLWYSRPNTPGCLTKRYSSGTSVLGRVWGKKVAFMYIHVMINQTELYNEARQKRSLQGLPWTTVNVWIYSRVRGRLYLHRLTIHTHTYISWGGFFAPDGCVVSIIEEGDVPTCPTHTRWGLRQVLEFRATTGIVPQIGRGNLGSYGNTTSRNLE